MLDTLLKFFIEFSQSMPTANKDVIQTGTAWNLVNDESFKPGETGFCV